MNTTLKARLLLGISATIIVTLSVTHYGLYMLMKRQLLTEFDEALAARVRALAVLIEQERDQIMIEFQHYPMQEFARSVRPEYYQVWHADGSVLARSRQLQHHDLPKLQGDRVVPQMQNLVLPDGRSGRAAGIRFRPNMEGELPEAAITGHGRTSLDPGHLDDDQDAFDLDVSEYASRPEVTLVVARDTQSLETSLSGLTFLLTGSGLLAATAILSVLAWLVSVNIRPLQQLAGQIGGINEQSLNQRFVLNQAPGELEPIVTRLNALMVRLETAFLREKTFTADVAHELRTPLAGIRSTLEVTLSRNREEEDYRRSIKKCLQISEETETIIATLLSLSRIEAGHAQLETDIVDLRQLLKSAWRPFAGRAMDENVKVIWNFEKEFVLKTDPAKLQVVFTNLFDNATSYVDSGGEIQIRMQCDEAGSPCVTVKNSGCCLTVDQAQQVCERFWRGDSSRSATGVHSGLGLALAIRIMQFLNGKIAVSVVDRWFVAQIQLPAACVENNDDGPHPEGSDQYRADMEANAEANMKANWEADSFRPCPLTPRASPSAVTDSQPVSSTPGSSRSEHAARSPS